MGRRMGHPARRQQSLGSASFAPWLPLSHGENMTVVSENPPTLTNADLVNPETGGAKPNFFIVGAPKCGTTAWAHYLSSHPEIYFPSAKEPHFFNTDQPNFRWAKTEEEYATYFANCGNKRVVAEASVQYLYSTCAARNISEYNPRQRSLLC